VKKPTRSPTSAPLRGPTVVRVGPLRSLTPTRSQLAANSHSPARTQTTRVPPDAMYAHVHACATWLPSRDSSQPPTNPHTAHLTVSHPAVVCPCCHDGQTMAVLASPSASHPSPRRATCRPSRQQHPSPRWATSQPRTRDRDVARRGYGDEVSATGAPERVAGAQASQGSCLRGVTGLRNRCEVPLFHQSRPSKCPRMPLRGALSFCRFRHSDGHRV
jgi:hypothetical protein